ncbi:hypothetical protein HPP92_007778 [Vanilla planifolia]|uniref:Uncharacterized protein n=1 Tax=Vanilla planifolia TaxID=51239 RepID=A0A835VBJ9_VANPL|nr:hypothetical protein HPP92_007778 [Vanilla planifolia]
MAMITHFGIFDSGCLALDIRGNGKRDDDLLYRSKKKQKFWKPEAVGDIEVDDVSALVAVLLYWKASEMAWFAVKCANR